MQMSNKFFSITLALVALATSAFAQKMDPKVQKQMEAGMKKTIAAFKAGDTKAILAGFSPDFKSKMKDGKTMGYKEMKAELEAWFSMTKSVDAKFTPKSINMTAKDTVVAVADYTFSWSMKTPDGKMHKMVMSGTNKETFKKMGNDWKIVMFEEQKEGTMMMDGKKVDPAMMSGAGGGG